MGADFPVSVKLNSDDFRKGGFSNEDCLRVVELLNSESVDLLEISGGIFAVATGNSDGGHLASLVWAGLMALLGAIVDTYGFGATFTIAGIATADSVTFGFGLEQLEAPTAYGLEDVAFLVAGHAGSTPRPVGKVASGGELSRIALAIAVTTSRLGEAQTLIFDEVDAGVGGAVAETVGRLMKQLGRDRQVLAVTHLPQVAACADHHLVVGPLTAGTVASVAFMTPNATAPAVRTASVMRISGTRLFLPLCSVDG